MQSVRNFLLSHLRVRVPVGERFFAKDVCAISNLTRWMCTVTDTNHDQIMARVISLVKKFDKVEGNKVTETTDFQKDLSLDSLDRVELVMAFEQEFSIEIPDEKADKLSSCADVAKYIVSESEKKEKKDSGSS